MVPHGGGAERGATMVEYGIMVGLVALVALVALAAVGIFGGSVLALFDVPAPF